MKNKSAPKNPRILQEEYYTKVLVFLYRIGTTKMYFTREEFSKLVPKTSFDNRMLPYLVEKKILTKIGQRYLFSIEHLMELLENKFYEWWEKNYLRKYSNHITENKNLLIKDINNQLEEDKLYYNEKFQSKFRLEKSDLKFPEQLRSFKHLERPVFKLATNEFRQQLYEILYAYERAPTKYCKENHGGGYVEDCCEYDKCNDWEEIFVNPISFEEVFKQILFREEENFLRTGESQIGKAYFIMERVKGVSLKRLVKENQQKERYERKRIKTKGLKLKKNKL